MGFYVRQLQEALDYSKSFTRVSGKQYKVYEFIKNPVFKYFVATEEEYNHELKLIEKRKERYKKKRGV